VKRLLSGAVALAAIVVSAAPASAAHLTLDDPAGDASNRGLDITSATLRNLGHRIVVDVEFVRSVRGDLIVSVDPRHDRGLRLVSEYAPTGHTRNYVADGAFTDGHLGEHADRIHCRGFRVRWSADEPSVRLVMPARCLDDGDYAAVRYAVLTERGADTDYAPDEQDSSGWVKRG
jgi:hypothetical protein